MKPFLRIPHLLDPHACEDVRSQMSDYLDGDLAVEATRRLERHVRFCRRCRRVLRNLRTTVALLGGLKLDDDAGSGAGGSPGNPPSAT